MLIFNLDSLYNKSIGILYPFGYRKRTDFEYLPNKNGNFTGGNTKIMINGME
jgi:hypothetical protein